MSAADGEFKSEVKSWLEGALKERKLKQLAVDVEGTTEKGSGYMGDIVFVRASGVAESGSRRKYDLALKCSKRSKTLRDAAPIRAAFLNEIFAYEEILPAFRQFQEDKGVSDAFDSVPKYFGTYIDETIEVLVLENLKKKGYGLWPMRRPLMRAHVDFLIREYAKLHATSIAFEQQEGRRFREFVDREDILKKFSESGDMQTLFGVPIEQSCEVLKDDLDENTLSKWRSFKDQIDFIFHDLVINVAGIKVILHGDCWNNNFLFLLEENNENVVRKVALLDWQLTRYSSPVLDISYFLFCCISECDIEDLDEILSIYHDTFVGHLRMLGIDEPQRVYPLDQLKSDWRTYSKYGVVMAALVLKISSTNQDEIVDVAEVVESGKQFSHSFAGGLGDGDVFKSRIRPIVEYAVGRGLI